MVTFCAAPSTTASPSDSAKATANRIHRADAHVRRMLRMVQRYWLSSRSCRCGTDALRKSSELHLRHDESEPGPTARLERSLERLARLCLVAAHEIPVAKAVGEGGDLHVVGIVRREHGFRSNLATIELQAPRVGVGHRLRIR